ncbi:Myb DNA-binding domain protein [Pyrenophora teres f. maculata]|nr:Myb DNA-binding domain protein [Pyrenophora teres f. maculata]
MMDSSYRPPRKWSSAEDQKLRDEVEMQLVIDGEVKDWCRIADSLPGRTNKDCRKRWHNSVAGGLKKGQWSSSEDQLLVRGVEQHGQRWTVVASCVGTRSADQCAKRWQQSLDPNLDRSEWRDVDDTMLVSAVHRLGRHWKDIQIEHFPGRSKNDIKNRYTVLVRRYQNQGIALPNDPSSPSDCGTPAALSSYPDDDEYNSFNSQIYDTILPPSQPDFDTNGYSTWSSPQAYAMSTTITAQNNHHSSNTHPPYAYAQPPPLPSNMPSNWDGAPHYMHHPLPLMHSNAPTNEPIYGYSAYQQPHMSHDLGSYTASMAQTCFTAMPDHHSPPPPTSGQQQHGYPTYTMAMSPDPRHPYYPFYHS